MSSEDWREEMYHQTDDEIEKRILKEGPKSLAESYFLGALYIRYKKATNGKTEQP